MAGFPIHPYQRIEIFWQTLRMKGKGRGASFIKSDEGVAPTFSEKGNEDEG
ncbi:MAG: hypothetical protein ABSG48_04760 [Geobacteraceae bacterium]|jgi:hypothetical protein